MSVRERQFARGRHFLRSSALATELVRSAGVEPGDLVVDIGAGGGVLTSALARAGADVIAIELDPMLAERLRRRFVGVVEGDALTVALPARPFRVVANLPFAIGTSLLRRVLRVETQLRSADVVVDWRLAAKRAAVWPSTRLGVEWSTWFELDLVRRLPRCCFSPPPSVDAALLRAVRRPEPLLPPCAAADYRRWLDRGFRDGVRAVAPPRTLKRLADELGFDRRAAPRDLDARQWAEVYRALPRGRENAVFALSIRPTR